MEKLGNRLYKLSSGHVLNVKVPPIPKVFKMVALIGSALKTIDIENTIKKIFDGSQSIENFDISQVDITVLRDLLSFLMGQEELYLLILENMKTSLLDDSPCDFEKDEYKEDLLEAMYAFTKETIYPFIKTPISRLRSQPGGTAEVK
ncbi:MAG: hypothetical protein J6T10_08645 [Methanobrevibacter sp.]|nr:hypothetical protein [Methanobrevibacter sp.]